MEQYINKIINADCFDILKQLPDKSVDLVFTDVPYKQEFYGRGMAKSRPNYLNIRDYGSNLNLNYTEFFELSLQKLKQVNFFTFCDKETKFEFISLAKKYKFGYHELAFCKTSPTPFTNNQWLPDIEWGLHIFKNIKVMGEYKTKRSFFTMPNFKEKDINHPTPKKVEIVEAILKNISLENDLVLDPFSGSGTTAIACHDLNRKFICIEKDIDYWKASVERLELLQQQRFLF